MFWNFCTLQTCSKNPTNSPQLWQLHPFILLQVCSSCLALCEHCEFHFWETHPAKRKENGISLLIFYRAWLSNFHGKPSSQQFSVSKQSKPKCGLRLQAGCDMNLEWAYGGKRQLIKTPSALLWSLTVLHPLESVTKHSLKLKGTKIKTLNKLGFDLNPQGA